MPLRPASSPASRLFIPLPRDDAGRQAALRAGYQPAIPPPDYKGTIEDWCAEMGRRGLTSDFATLAMLMIRRPVYDQIASACDGGDCGAIRPKLFNSKERPRNRGRHPCPASCGMTFKTIGAAAQHGFAKHKIKP